MARARDRFDDAGSTGALAREATRHPTERAEGGRRHDISELAAAVRAMVVALQPAVTMSRVVQRRRYTGEEKDVAVQLVLNSGQTYAATAQQLGIGVGTLKGWVHAERVRRRGQDWLNRVRPYFDFLHEYGFDQVDVEADRWWRVRVTYRSTVNAVAIDYSIESVCVELFLIKVVDGELADVQGADAGWLLTLGHERQRAPKGLSDSEVEAGLAFWSDALPRYASGYLSGDLSVLHDIDRAIERRIARRNLTGDQR